ncbi:MAG TPA: prolipoprotein diacylglyceryl transferase family protein, partial [Paenibacillaceae bacterium]
QMIGRWGNFVNQEAHGGPVTEEYLRETLHLPGFIVDQMYIDGQYYHPTFLYESVWNLLVLLLLLALRRWSPLRAGELFWTYLMTYSLGRFFIEGMRTDSLAFRGPEWLAALIDGLWTPMRLILGEPGYLDPAYGNIRVSQLLALALVVAMIVTIAVRRMTLPNAARYSDPLVPAGAAAGSDDAAPSGAKSAEAGPADTASAGAAADGPKAHEADGGTAPGGGNGKDDSRT